MSNKLKALKVQKILKQKGMRLFSKQEFQHGFGVSESAARFFLFHHCRSGLFVRIKNGLYALADDFPLEEEIANRLYQPSYISFEYVLARHGVIPEAVYNITSATPKPSRQFSVEGKQYEYSTIKKEAYTGYYPAKIKDRIILIAKPEKAFVDTFYFVHLGKRTLNERLNLSLLSKSAILDYAKLFSRPWLLKEIRESFYDG